MVPLITNHRYKGLTPDEKVVSQLADALNAKLVAYETILSRQKYLAGNVSYLRQILMYHMTSDNLICSGDHACGFVRSSSLPSLKSRDQAQIPPALLVAQCWRMFVQHSAFAIFFWLVLDKGWV